MSPAEPMNLLQGSALRDEDQVAAVDCEIHEQGLQFEPHVIDLDEMEAGQPRGQIPIPRLSLSALPGVARKSCLGQHVEASDEVAAVDSGEEPTHRAGTAEDHSPDSCQASISPGSLVRLVGLKEFDDDRGLVVAWDVDTERWKVVVEDGSRILVRPPNLRLVAKPRREQCSSSSGSSTREPQSAQTSVAPSSKVSRGSRSSRRKRQDLGVPDERVLDSIVDKDLGMATSTSGRTARTGRSPQPGKVGVTHERHRNCEGDLGDIDYSDGSPIFLAPRSPSALEDWTLARQLDEHYRSFGREAIFNLDEAIQMTLNQSPRLLETGDKKSTQKKHSRRHRTSPPVQSIANGSGASVGDHDSDLMLAVSLQQQEFDTRRRHRSGARAAVASPVALPEHVSSGVNDDNLSDFILAASLQQEELDARRRQRAELRQLAEARNHAELKARIQTVHMQDIVWGELRGDKNGEPPSWLRQMVFFFLPCCAIGCGNSGVSRKEVWRAWRRCLFSWSFLLSLGQTGVFVAAIVLEDGFAKPALNPMLGPRLDVFYSLGAKNAAKILQGEWWRVITPIALHAGVVHLVGNLGVQLRTGLSLEVMWGHIRWITIYLSSGIIATLSSCAFLPNKLSVGSSGALCGLIGGWLAFIAITWNQTLPNDRRERKLEIVNVSVSIIFIVAMSWVPLIDFAAHIGGLIAGGFLGLLLFADRLQSKRWRAATSVVGFILYFGLLFGVLFMFLYYTEPEQDLLHV